MLKNIHVKNFRNLSDLTIDQLGRVNLFTGRNNSGKTTLLEALFLLVGAGNPGMTLNINALRGIDSVGGTPTVVQDTFWKPMFSALDMTKTITVEANMTSLGRLKLDITLERPNTIQVPLEDIGGPPVTELSNESTLLFSFDGKPGEHGEGRMRVAGNGIQIEQPNASVPFQAMFLSSRLGNLQEDAVRLGQLRTRKQTNTVEDALKIIEPRLQHLEANPASGTPLIWGDVGLAELVPLPVMGEGMTRVARLILGISSAPGGLVLVDEIENGLHHSILSKVWKAVDKAAKNFDTQVIATTHSYECLEAACQALGAEDFRLHRLEAGKGQTFEKRKIRCVTYEPDEIHAAIHHNFEVR